MPDQRACQYLGCEDVAVEYLAVPGDGFPHDVLLCPGHAPYVRRALTESGRGDVRVTAGDYGGERTRVWVWKAPAAPG